MFEVSHAYHTQAASAPQLPNYQAQALNDAIGLYNRARRRAWLGMVRAAITRRSRRLLDLAAMRQTWNVRGQHDRGIVTVPLSQIRGSENRVNDFDGAFNPLQAHTRSRWLSIAIAHEAGLPLPPVKLIQVGDSYYVQDGHHRISVAWAMDGVEVDASVIVWDVAEARSVQAQAHTSELCIATA
jgi:hypothetical protein